MQPKLRECDNPECSNTFTQYNSLNKWCSYSCKKKCGKVKSPPKMSAKRKVESKLYSELRIKFLSDPKNQVCFIDGCYNPAETCEHTRGRVGYADDWARENKISLYLDVRFWAPCCLEHNLELETNSELSKKYQLSKIHGGKKL